MNCANCGRPSQAGARYCTHCGHELFPQKENAPQPVRRVNNFDERMKDMLRSKTLKIYLGCIFILLCGLPVMIVCAFTLGLIPMINQYLPFFLYGGS